MNILDENLPKNQRQLLDSWRIHIRQIGFDIGRRGMQDEEIIPLLLQQRRPTFFTRDEGFYEYRLCHARYGLALRSRNTKLLSSRVRYFAIRSFDTQAKRMGKVIRASRAGISFWRLHAAREIRVRWEKN